MQRSRLRRQQALCASCYLCTLLSELRREALRETYDHVLDPRRELGHVEGLSDNLHAGRKVAPGALYTTLDRLSTKGLLVSREGEPTAVRGGRAKRFYTVTPEGRTLLVEAQRSFQRMMAGLKLLEEEHG